MTDKGMYMDTRQAGGFRGLASRTLSRYRVSGDGPVFHRFGAWIRYRREGNGHPRRRGDETCGIIAGN